MIVFDVDGTLIGGEAVDWACFDAAFEEVAGFSLTAAFFETIEEITAQAIVHQALVSFSLDERKHKERAVYRGYLSRLQAACVTNPSAFPAIRGAAMLLQDLKDRGLPVAIATGDWRETISFKLQAAGISIEGIPLVTSSDFYGRADIIAAAVAKSGRSISEAIYVGDGLWDLRACKKLGIPFIGVGRRKEKLQAAGARHVLADLNPLEFWQVREAIGQTGCELR